MPPVRPGDGRHRQPDKVIKTMRETGADMKVKYRDRAPGWPSSSSSAEQRSARPHPPKVGARAGRSRLIRRRPWPPQDSPLRPSS
jgi:hypothetical protein